MNHFQSSYGRWLYQALPPLYRESDNTRRDGALQVEQLGDLAQYLDACGVLLDQLRATLDQRLADAFADNPNGTTNGSTNGSTNGLTNVPTSTPPCQEWLLPYFARLLDVNVVAPDLRGRRDEVYNAIRWRQRKGTAVAAEEIGEAVTGGEAELQEGWQRIALTPRVGEPLLPASAWGLADGAVQTWPSRIVRHPGLPAVTIDLRRSSRAVRSNGGSGLSTRHSRLGGVDIDWRQAAPHGAPAHPGAFDDVSRRTVDLRQPTPTRGLAHPRRLLAYTALPQGRFVPPAAHFADVAALQSSLDVEWTREPAAPTPGQPFVLTIRRRADHDVVLDSGLDLGPLLPGAATDVRVQLEGLQVRGAVHLPRGHLQLLRVTASQVTVDTAGAKQGPPVLLAQDSLIGTVAVPAGQAVLERCTVRRDARCWSLRARDTLFHGELTRPGSTAAPEVADLQHCRIPATLQSAAQVVIADCSIDIALFFASSADDAAGSPVAPDAGVLRPGNPLKVLTGATDGGEIGWRRGGLAGTVLVVQRPQQLTLAARAGQTLRDLVFADTLDVLGASRGGLVLERVAARHLRVATPSASDATNAGVPVLDALGCVFGDLRVQPGWSRLEACTVLGNARVARLQASECLFAGSLDLGNASSSAPHCLRYSRLPTQFLGRAGVPQLQCTAARPAFYIARFADGLAGVPGCAVLHWAAPAALAGGAEDGGEIGAYHDDRLVLRQAAAVDKLLEHLPAGMAPLLVPDPRLAQLPPLPPASTVPGGP